MSAPLPRVAVEALLRRMGSPPSQEHLLALAGELGHLLAEGMLTSADARAVRLSFVKMEKHTDARDVLSQVNVYTTMLSAYELSRQSHEQEAESALQLGAESQRILRALSAESRTAAQLAGGKDNGKIGRHLEKLEQRGLVESVPATDSRKRTRVLTALGHVVVSRLPPSPAERSQPSVSVERLLSLCVQSTLRALKSIRMSPAASLLRRADVLATFAPELRPHGVVESFEYFGESYGEFDIDEAGRFWSTDQNSHEARWNTFFDLLKHDTAIRQLVVAQLETESIVILTVNSRVAPWREALADLPHPAAIETVESWRMLYSESDRNQGTVVVDDTTLALNVAKTERRTSKTIDLNEGRLRLRPSFPAAASAP